MSFKDIKGNQKALYALREDLRQGRLAASYLFLGPEGIGKRKTAIALAKVANCERAELDSCDSCPPCLKIEAQNHPDVHLISGQNPDSIKIEDIRQLKKEIGLKAYEGKRKFFIIDNAHCFTAEASNALLKILEEPPGEACIILISSKFTLLFKTIVSRCRMVRFYPLARLELARILEQDYQLGELAAHFLAYFCEGRLGRGIEMKDKDILKEKNKIINDFALSNKSNIAGATAERREILRNNLNILASWFRDVLMVKMGLAEEELIHLDRKADLTRAAKDYDFNQLEAIMNFISDSLLYLQSNINPKLLLSNLRMELSRA